MDFFEVINNRKTIRKYKDEQPPIEDITRIIDAGRLAPCVANAQNWKFIAILNYDVKQRMFYSVMEKYDEIINWEECANLKHKVEFYKYYLSFFRTAPLLIAIVEKPKSSIMKEIYDLREMEADEQRFVWSDSSLLGIGAATENMTLAAQALGYGSCWMSAPIAAGKEFVEILNLKEHERVVSLLTIGKPDEKALETPRQFKKSLYEVMQVIE